MKTMISPNLFIYGNKTILFRYSQWMQTLELREVGSDALLIYVNMQGLKHQENAHKLGALLLDWVETWKQGIVKMPALKDLLAVALRKNLFFGFQDGVLVTVDERGWIKNGQFFMLGLEPETNELLKEPDHPIETLILD